MSYRLTDIWQREAGDARFAELTAVGGRLTAFERKVRRRNVIEYAAGTLVIVLFGAVAAAALMRGEIAFALGFLLVLAGTGLVMWNLHRRGSNLERRPEDSCREHLRRQYEHQRAALAAVPLWYLGPLVPGMLLIFGTVTAKVAEQAGWATALAGIAGPAAISFGIFGVIALLNLWGAKQLTREIRALDEMSEDE